VLHNWEGGDGKAWKRWLEQRDGGSLALHCYVEVLVDRTQKHQCRPDGNCRKKQQMS
jgi:hypothetical protein